MNQRAWTECHVEAFEFFGGVPARLVPDNLKTGVDKLGLYDPKINRPMRSSPRIKAAWSIRPGR